jgi:hypothetical protein
MIFKKIIAVFFIICFITLYFCNLTTAGGWDQCKGCHNGNLAPDAKELSKKYDTVDKFVAAAKRSENSLMVSIKRNEKLLREAAKDIGLK